MFDEQEQCPKCKITKSYIDFCRVFKKLTYSIESDDEGYIHYYKKNKLCNECREYIYSKSKKK